MILVASCLRCGLCKKGQVDRSDVSCNSIIAPEINIECPSAVPAQGAPAQGAQCAQCVKPVKAEEVITIENISD